VKLFHFTIFTFFLSTVFVTQTLAQTSTKSSLKGNGEVLYNIPQQKVDSPLGMLSEGQVYGRVRSNTFVFSSLDADGAYTTPVSAIGVSLLYKSASYSGFDFTVGAYATYSFFNEDDFSKYVRRQKAKDTFSRYNYANKDEKYMLVLGQANLSYTYSKTKIILGRQLVETFYTRSNDTKMIPNSFDGVVLQSDDIKNTKITLAYLSRQKLRDHTQTHSILMYGDANTTSSLKPQWSENDDSAMHKGLTYTALRASGKTTDAPLVVLNTLNKSIKNLKLNFAAYSVPSLISQIMLEANYKIPVGYVTITPAFRYIQQFDNGAGAVGGASLGGEASSISPSGYTNPDSLDTKMIAAKLVTQFADIKINLAYTDILNEADLVTPWRGFPTSGYTRSMGIYNWKANTKSYRAFISKGSNKSGNYKDALYIFSLLYLDEDTKKGQEDSMYYYAGIVKNLQSYPELQYRVRLGYRDFYNDAYSSKDYLDARLEFNYLF